MDINWAALGVFQTESDFYIYFAWFLFCNLAFTALFFAIKSVAPGIVSKIDPKFANLKPKDKMEYYSRIVSNIHATAALVMTTVGIWFNCEDGGSIFSSDACLMKPQKVQIYLVLMSSAYCLYDLYVCLFQIKYSVKQGSDFIFHHVVGLAGAALSLILGRANVALSSAALMSEASNFAMNMRWFMLKHGKADHKAFLPLSYTFMMCFFLSRVVFMLMIFVRNMQSHYIFDPRNQAPVLFYMQMINDVMLFILYLLQLWWFYAII